MPGERLQPSSPEVRKELLKSATQDVASVYSGGETIGNSWEEVAGRHSEFGGKIRELGGRMKLVKKMGEMEEGYNRIKNEFRGKFFAGVESERAQTFLTDVLFSRGVTEEGNFNMFLDSSGEAQDMAKQIGLPKPEQISPPEARLGLPETWFGFTEPVWESEKAKGITLNDCIGKVLTGDLEIGYKEPEVYPWS
jgi:hypothetical protein